MKRVYRFDENRFYIEPVRLNDDEDMPSDCVEKIPTQGIGIIKHKWNGSDWEEGLTQEEIDAIKNASQSLTPLEEIDLLKKQQADLIFELVMNGVL